MRISRKSKILVPVLCILVCFVVLVVLLYQKNETIFIRVTSLFCHKRSVDLQRECFEEKILERVEKNPQSIKPLFNTIWELGREGSLSYDMRLFSPIIHDVGMHLVETNTPLAEAISLCPLSFRGGCIHGVIMEYLDTVQSENISTWPKTVCEPFKKTSIVYKNCFHALGHEFAAKSKENLNGMLLLCKNVPSGYRSDCLYGVLMEFSKGESGSGRHLEIPVGKYTPSCEPLEEDFKITCYTSVGFYGQYEADGESLETTYKKCELLPEIYKQYCFEGIAGALLFSEATDRGSASLRCKVLPSKFINICLTSI